MGLARPIRGPGQGPTWGRAQAYLDKNIFQKLYPENLNIAYIIESWHFGILTKKTRAEQYCIWACFVRPDLSYETDK